RPPPAPARASAWTPSAQRLSTREEPQRRCPRVGADHRLDVVRIPAVLRPIGLVDDVLDRSLGGEELDVALHAAGADASLRTSLHSAVPAPRSSPPRAHVAVLADADGSDRYWLACGAVWSQCGER